jgi:hypothetical protein
MAEPSAVPIGIGPPLIGRPSHTTVHTLRLEVAISFIAEHRFSLLYRQ